MVKVKTKAGAGKVAAVGMVPGKKNKNQKKVLKVVSKRNGAAQPAAPLIQPAVSLKAKKKKNRKRRNKMNKSVTQNETPSETTAKEVVSQESGSESNEQQNGEKDKNAPASNKTSGTQKNEVPTSIVIDIQKGESMTSKPLEPKSKNPEAQEAGKENTESGENESNTQGKKKKKRKNKRKASEALEGTDGTIETVEDKKDSEEDKAGEIKASKRQKVEEKKEGEESMEDENAELKKSKQKKEKKHVLFIGNLPFEATEEDIREHFKVVCDDIVRVTLMSRQKNGKGKGYGFLELGNATAYNTALKLNLSQFKDRKINVEFTTPGKNTKKRKSFIKLKTKKLLGQKKGNKGKKKKGGRKH